jgi:hypothetical protein
MAKIGPGIYIHVLFYFHFFLSQSRLLFYYTLSTIFNFRFLFEQLSNGLFIIKFFHFVVVQALLAFLAVYIYMYDTVVESASWKIVHRLLSGNWQNKWMEFKMEGFHR